MAYNQYSNNKNKKPGIPWWAIVVCFCCGLWPVGVVLLIYKLGKESGAFSGSRSQPRDEYGRFVSQQPPRPECDPYRTVKEDSESYRQQKQTAKSATTGRPKSAAATASQPRASASAAAGYSTAQAGRGQVKGRMKRQGNKLKNAKMLTIIGAAVMGVFGFPASWPLPTASAICSMSLCGCWRTCFRCSSLPVWARACSPWAG